MAGTTRYLRYILFAFVVLVVLFFISSSSSATAVPGAGRLPSAAEILRQQGSRWKGSFTPGTKESQGDSAPDVGHEDISPQTTTTTHSSPQQTQEMVVPGREGTLNSSPNPALSEDHSILKGAKAPGERVNATFVTLARNGDVWEIARSIRQVEDRFNRAYNYDWVFLNDAEFDDTFKKVTTSLTSGRARYGKIETQQWGFPDFIDQSRAAKVREEMAVKQIIYGDSISYRHMCRYESGFFFRHPLMMEYEYYWRVEPSIELFCDVSYDPFKYMKDHGKKYSFVLSLYEYTETIPTLWNSVKAFMKKYPEHIVADNSMSFISDDGGETYNNCHFWSNFEIGDLRWLRSSAYLDYFDHLDHDGGFFYERWGDAPVHSIAAALTLSKDEIHFFNDIAYYHVPFTHCPSGEQTRLDLKCHCNPSDNFDWNSYSCTSRFFKLHGMEQPSDDDKRR